MAEKQRKKWMGKMNLLVALCSRDSLAGSEVVSSGPDRPSAMSGHISNLPSPGAGIAQ